MTLFWSNAGPLLRYRDGALEIEDLNPEMKVTWSLSRGELWRIGLRCIYAAITERRR